MIRNRLIWALILLAPVSLATAQEIRRGKVKSLDVEKLQIVITVDGADRDLVLNKETRVLDATGRTLAERLQGIAPGTEIFFQLTSENGREVRAVKRAGANDSPQRRQDGRRGVVRKVDVERRVITVNVGTEEREFAYTDELNVRGLEGKSLDEKLKNLTTGTPLMFRVRTEDGKEIVTDLLIGRAERGSGRKLTDTSALKPLPELASAKYQGFEGGLYPQGQNVRPEKHEKAGLAFAKKVTPLGRNGKPDPDGRIVLLSVGMSNTSQSSQGFSLALAVNKNPRLAFVNGAQGGMTAAIIQSDRGRGEQYWSTIEQRLEEARLTPEQVQAVWIKQADAGPTSGFPEYAKTLEGELANIVQLVAKRFPNCHLAYLSSRTYGGFATTALNPEPYAYESGFAVKWLIERQIGGDKELNFDSELGEVRAPWLSWGPYLWANGNTPRADGYFYDVSDFGNDGTHQSPAGQRKVGKLLFDFFNNDSTTRSWFRGPE